jgi:hypothetical protein
MRNTLIAIVISLVAVLGVISCLVFVGTSDGPPPYVFDFPPNDPLSVTSDAREEQGENTLAERNGARGSLRPRTGLSLAGTVVNADRRSVAGAEVELRPADTSTSTAVALATARTDATGRYTLTFEGSSAGIYQVAVRHADYLPEIKRWSGASQGAVDIQLSFRPATGASTGPERRVRVYVPPPKRDPEPTELVRKPGRDRSDRRGNKSDRRGNKSDRRGELKERFDQDGDGKLSDEERQAARESRGGGRRGGDREGGGRAGRGRGGGRRGGVRGRR